MLRRVGVSSELESIVIEFPLSFDIIPFSLVVLFVDFFS